MYDKNSDMSMTNLSGSLNFQAQQTNIENLQRDVHELSVTLEKLALNQLQMVNDMQAIYQALRIVSDSLTKSAGDDLFSLKKTDGDLLN